MKNRKVLLLMTNLVGGGADRVTLSLAEDWRRHGAEVVVVTLMPAQTDAYAIPAGVRRIALNFSGKRGSLADLLRNHIAPVLAVRRVLRAERPDVAIGITTVAAVALALARSGDAIAIGAEHGHTPVSHYGRIWELARRHAYARLDAVVALTSETAELLRVRTRARRLVVIPNAVCLPVPENEPRLAVGNVVAPGRKLLLAVGRFVEQKGFDRLLDAFAQVAARHAYWDLVILGEGELRGALEAQAARLGLKARVFLPGHAGNVADWYRAADGFVLSSRWEGFGMVLIEAMAHGCAVVGVDCDVGPRDMIRDGENGLLVAQDDAAALVKGLDRLLGDAALRRRLASRAGEVRERFSPQRVRGMWGALFDGLQERRGENGGNPKGIRVAGRPPEK